jgi:hypothetical protein
MVALGLRRIAEHRPNSTTGLTVSVILIETHAFKHDPFSQRDPVHFLNTRPCNWLTLSRKCTDWIGVFIENRETQTKPSIFCGSCVLFLNLPTPSEPRQTALNPPWRICYVSRRPGFSTEFWPHGLWRTPLIQCHLMDTRPDLIAEGLFIFSFCRGFGFSID